MLKKKKSVGVRGGRDLQTSFWEQNLKFGVGITMLSEHAFCHPAKNVASFYKFVSVKWVC